MFSIVEGKDGSTDILERSSVKRLCVIPAQQNGDSRILGPDETRNCSNTSDTCSREQADEVLTKGEPAMPFSPLKSVTFKHVPQSCSSRVPSSSLNEKPTTVILSETTNCSSTANPQESRKLRPHSGGTDDNKEKHLQVTFDVNHQLPHKKMHRRPVNDPMLVVLSTNSKPENGEHLSPSRMRLLRNNGGARSNETLHIPPNAQGLSRKLEHLPPDKPESDFIDEQTFFKYLNLNSKKDLQMEEKHAPISWPVRDVSKEDSGYRGSTTKRVPYKTGVMGSSSENQNGSVESDVRPEELSYSMKNNAAVQTLQFPRQELQHEVPVERKQLFVLKVNHAERTKGKSVLLVLPSCVFQAPNQQANYMNRINYLKQQMALEEQLRSKQDLNRFISRYMCKVEISSPLGIRIMSNSPYVIRQQSKEELVRSYELHCGTSCKELVYAMLNNHTVHSSAILSSTSSVSSSSRMLRSNNVLNDNIVNSGPRNYTHTYAFSKKQRLEKRASLETGLNWKGRILAWFCKPVEIKLEKLELCPLCEIKVCPKRGHACGNDACDSSVGENGSHSVILDSPTTLHSEIPMEVEPVTQESVDN